jgi:hypothetical protein
MANLDELPADHDGAAFSLDHLILSAGNGASSGPRGSGKRGEAARRALIFPIGEAAQ